MKEKSRYLVINPDQKDPEEKSHKVDGDQEYTEGFYSSSSDNDDTKEQFNIGG